MKRPQLFRSVYTRTILQLTLAIVITFFVLGLVYYRMVSQNTIQQQATQLRSGAQAISEVMSQNLTSDGELSDPRLISYVNFTARSSGAVVWVINPSGEVILQTGMPGDSGSRLERSERGYPQLPSGYLMTLGTGLGGTSQLGDFESLFTESDVRWISAAHPMPTPLGVYRGEVQLHYPLETDDIGSFLMTNGLIMAFLIAFLIALVFIGILSHNITKPIRLMSDTAGRVSRGDLDARIEIPGIKNASPEEMKRALVTDDLTVLVHTMNTMLDKLQNQERVRKEFISNVSHDLRTPLTSIRGFIEGLIDGTIPQDRASHYLSIIRKETMRLQTMVSTMFDATLIESGQKLNESVFDINEVLREDIIALESLLAEKNLGVQTDFSQDEEGQLLVVADREAISRVVYNILSNAINYTPQDGVIALTTRRSNRPKVIDVLIDDSGPGIPPQARSYVFDRFYKMDKSRTAKGSGLGLYICRTILSAHGQRIEVTDSELGGACFIFTLATP